MVIGLVVFVVVVVGLGPEVVGCRYGSLLVVVVVAACGCWLLVVVVVA